ncbi:hypothetical protein NUM3379_18900 [Kineococcus sp. NUM-3379]
MCPLVLGALGGCSGGDEPAPEPEHRVSASTIAFDAATAAGANPRGAGGGTGHQTSSVTLGHFTGGTTYGAFAACTGGGSVGLDLAGTAVVVECDGQGRRVGELLLPNDAPTFRVTRLNDVPSEWGVALTWD